MTRAFSPVASTSCSCAKSPTYGNTSLTTVRLPTNRNGTTTLGQQKSEIGPRKGAYLNDSIRSLILRVASLENEQLVLIEYSPHARRLQIGANQRKCPEPGIERHSRNGLLPADCSCPSCSSSRRRRHSCSARSAVDTASVVCSGRHLQLHQNRDFLHCVCGQ